MYKHVQMVGMSGEGPASLEWAYGKIGHGERVPRVFSFGVNATFSNKKKRGGVVSLRGHSYGLATCGQEHGRAPRSTPLKALNTSEWHASFYLAETLHPGPDGTTGAWKEGPRAAPPAQTSPWRQ